MKTTLSHVAHMHLHWGVNLMLVVAVCGVFLCSSAGCGEPAFLEDPLQAATIEALGPEDPAVPVGPLHRPGQPCAACHRPGGVASPHTAAGTVFRDPAMKIPVADVLVAFADAKGQTFTTRTNCVGSFYVKDTEFVPTFPFWVSVQWGGEFPYKMSSPVHREASCAACHLDPAGPRSAGHVFLTDDPTTYASIQIRACTDQDGVSR